MAVQDAHARYARIVKALLKEEGVSVGAETKEWAALEPSTQEKWPALAREAMRFVASKK